MSRTYKDDPYFIQAKRKGKVQHDASCLTYSPTRTASRTTTEIFYANEVKQMEALETRLTENGDTFTVQEKSGYLVTRISLEGEKFPWRSKRKELPYRELVDDERKHFSAYTEKSDYAPFVNRNHTVSNFDIFYIYTITQTTTKPFNGWGPRGHEQDTCCSPIIGHWSSQNCCGHCDWCEREEESSTDLRSSLANVTRAANCNDVSIFGDNRNDDDPDAPVIVYTSHSKQGKM